VESNLVESNLVESNLVALQNLTDTPLLEKYTAPK